MPPHNAFYSAMTESMCASTTMRLVVCETKGVAHDAWHLCHLPLCFAGLTMQQEEEAGNGARSALCAVDSQSQRAANAPRLAALDAG